MKIVIWKKKQIFFKIFYYASGYDDTVIPEWEDEDVEQGNNNNVVHEEESDLDGEDDLSEKIQKVPKKVKKAPFSFGKKRECFLVPFHRKLLLSIG